MISFNTIAADIRTPGSYLEIDSTRALGGLPVSPSRTLIIGQRLATGTVAALVKTLMPSAAAASAAFGRGSQLAQMVAAYKAVDDTTELWAIAIDDLVAGVAGSATLTIAGPATASGTLALMVQGVKVPVGVTQGDTASVIATNIAAAIAAQPDLIVNAAAAAQVVTLTCKHKGLLGFDIDVRCNYYSTDVMPTGVSVAIQAAAGAAGVADVSPVWAAIGDARFAAFVLPYADPATMTSVEAELASRWGSSRMLETIAYAGYRGTFGTTAAFGNSRDSAFVSSLGMRNGPCATWAIAAAYAAACTFAGSIDPARPFQTLELTGILPPAQVDRWTRQEAELLLRDGISTYTVGHDGVPQIQRAITMYQTSALGLPDISFLSLNTPLTLAYVRYAVRARIALKFPRMKLAADNAAFGAGQAIVTPSIIRAELIALFREMEDAGIVQDVDGWKSELRVEIDGSSPDRVDAILPPKLVGQFDVFAASIQFRL